MNYIRQHGEVRTIEKEKALISQGLFAALDVFGLCDGAEGLGRTGMPVRALDFESTNGFHGITKANFLPIQIKTLWYTILHPYVISSKPGCRKAQFVCDISRPACNVLHGKTMVGRPRMAKIVLQRLMGIVLFSACVVVLPRQSSATEEYAKQTGQACAVCHLDSGGGGELTTAGKAFAKSLQTTKVNPGRGAFAKGFRFIIGYIHFLTAIFWFGTILYVHLILKPAYAASGLPRGELRVGIVSMAVMGVTGSILSCYRISSFDTLVHTRFGILLFIKVCLYLVMVISALFVIIVIGPRLKAKRKESSISGTTGELTLDDLAAFDGKDGRPAYFAFEGKVYDATQSKLWKQGVHMGRHYAGNDLTEALSLAPHGRDKVTAMAAAGELVDSGPRKAPLHERVFFFMAHMNLVMVFIIILILSLWRWG